MWGNKKTTEKIIKIHADHMGALDAIRQFLLVAIESQQHFDGIIQTTADSDDEFIRLNGFSKEELKEGVKALKEAIK